MSEQQSGEARASVATVIQGFTDAELALREVAGAIERFRGAAEQLADASQDQAAARAAMVETAQMTDRVAQQVSGVVEGLKETAAVLRGVDPDRLWPALEKIEAAQLVIAGSLDQRMSTVDRWLERIGAQQAVHAAAFEARMTALDRVALRLIWLTGGAFILGFVAAALLVAIVTGLVVVR